MFVPFSSLLILVSFTFLPPFSLSLSPCLSVRLSPIPLSRSCNSKFCFCAFALYIIHYIVVSYRYTLYNRINLSFLFDDFFLDTFKRESYLFNTFNKILRLALSIQMCHESLFPVISKHYFLSYIYLASNSVPSVHLCHRNFFQIIN